MAGERQDHSRSEGDDEIGPLVTLAMGGLIRSLGLESIFNKGQYSFR